MTPPTLTPEAIAAAVARVERLEEASRHAAQSEGGTALDAMRAPLGWYAADHARAAASHALDAAALRLLLALAAQHVPAEDREQAKHLYLGAVMTRIEAGGYSAAAHQTMTLADRLLKLEPPESQP